MCARATSPGLVSVGVAPAHLLGNVWGDTDVVPHYVIVPRVTVQSALGMLGPNDPLVTVMLLQRLRMCLCSQGEEMNEMGLPTSKGG